ncbi:HAD hydrolase-like protein [Alkalibaculum sp. M08DMB]|uniref:HAD hydrolase-like protein n=1 Tax=Alkalibaculum sporogenes TaxID=2655001 RepID=A0A6A7KCA9_9FIRM|nr:HAD hydrolase-like protein [Alkalibaculum sporogenes]MPW27179.1 HAD hydrolase-like protein [Alkalibaculum sporogenes]
MRYKAVVFDFDGTIVDSEEGIAIGFQHALKSQGISEDLEVIKSLIGPPLSRTIITKYGLSEEDGEKAMQLHREYYTEIGIYQCKLYPLIIEMLEGLKAMGVKMMIATNKAESYAIEQIKYCEIGQYFTCVVGNNETQTRGTKAEFIDIAIGDLGINKNEIMMVGDRYNDIEAGKEAHLDTVGVTYGYGSITEINDIAPTYIINSPLELIDIVKG